jgi:histone H3/H4
MSTKKSATKKDITTKKTKKSGKNNTVDGFKFDVYVYKVLKQVHPDTGMSGSALATVVNLVKVNVDKIMKAANEIIRKTGAKTLTSRYIQTAVRLVIRGDICKHSVMEGTKAVTKYSESEGGSKKSPLPRSKRAGLVFSIARIENLMKLSSIAPRKGSGAAVYLAAVIEYLTAEILELAGNIAIENKKVRITLRHLKIAISADQELSYLFRDTVLGGGIGVNALQKPNPVKEKKSKPKVKRGISKNSTKKSVKKSPAKKNPKSSHNKPGKIASKDKPCNKPSLTKKPPVKKPKK